MLCHFPAIFVHERLRSDRHKRSYADDLIPSCFISDLNLGPPSKVRDRSPDRKRRRTNEKAYNDEEMEVDGTSSCEVEERDELEDMMMDYEAENKYYGALEGMDICDAEPVPLSSMPKRRKACFCRRFTLRRYSRKRKWSGFSEEPLNFKVQY